MVIRFLLLCLFCMGTVWQATGQQEIPENLYKERHFVFWNITNFVDPNGASFQLGYNYQIKSWIDFQMEIGFVSDDLIPTRLPFKEYAGFRIRPQIKILDRNSFDKPYRLYGGILLSYQRLNFKENSNFSIENSFNQNITYRGYDQMLAGYVVGGIEMRSNNRFVASISIAIGQVSVKSETTEGNIPENATIISDCVIFCGRSEFLNFNNTRPGFLFDVKVGYRF